jgi:hypothetical protein
MNISTRATQLYRARNRLCTCVVQLFFFIIFAALIDVWVTTMQRTHDHFALPFVSGQHLLYLLVSLVAVGFFDVLYICVAYHKPLTLHHTEVPRSHCTCGTRRRPRMLLFTRHLIVYSPPDKQRIEFWCPRCLQMIYQCTSTIDTASKA